MIRPDWLRVIPMTDAEVDDLIERVRKADAAMFVLNPGYRNLRATQRGATVPLPLSDFEDPK